MKYISVILLLLFSCKNDKEIDLIRIQNQKLTSENLRLTKYIQSLSIRAIVIPKSSKLKLGEEYMADVRLAIVDPLNPPKCVLGELDSVSFNFVRGNDSLKYDADLECLYYITKPKTKGTYFWSGRIINKLNDKVKEYYFKTSYVVY